jgi:hypothetical protein
MAVGEKIVDGWRWTRGLRVELGRGMAVWKAVVMVAIKRFVGDGLRGVLGLVLGGT